MLWFFLVYRALLVRGPVGFLRVLWTARSAISAAESHTPLAELDEVLLGRRVDFFQDGLAEPTEEGPFWCHRDVLCDLQGGVAASVAADLPPIQIITGWADFFLDQAISDFEHAQAADARLTVGAHDHWGLLHLPNLSVAYRTCLELLDEHLGPSRRPPREFPALPGYTHRRSTPIVADARQSAELSTELRRPVQLCMMGTRRWRGYARWPPVDATREKLLWLTSARRLSFKEPEFTAKVERTLVFPYDPSDPTPALGGPSFNPLNSGMRNQYAIERRADVLVFSSPMLRRNLVVVGYVRLHLRAASSAPSADFVARLCEASPVRGSVNVCEGLQRLHADLGTNGVGGDAGQECVVSLGPIACEFSAGSRIRLHVCSAAHPRWMRNLNQPEHVAVANQPCGAPSLQRVWVDDRGTRLVLPVEDA